MTTSTLSPFRCLTCSGSHTAACDARWSAYRAVGDAAAAAAPVSWQVPADNIRRRIAAANRAVQALESCPESRATRAELVELLRELAAAAAE